MNYKVYWSLFPFALILGLFFIFALPERGSTFAFITVIVFWIVYYTWTYINKRRSKE